MENKKLQIAVCSGASNTGEYADLTARKLMKNGSANMLCLTRFSIDNKFTESVKAKGHDILVLDGCDINCGKIILENAGIKNFKHMITTDFDIIKGKTPVNEDKVNEIADFITKAYNNGSITF